jgi:hypothetical protein
LIFNTTEYWWCVFILFHCSVFIIPIVLFTIKLNQFVSNLEAVDAKQIYQEEYRIWREDPANFLMNGRYPVRDLWKAARDCWKEILLSPVRFLFSLILSFASILFWKWVTRLVLFFREKAFWLWLTNQFWGH